MFQDGEVKAVAKVVSQGVATDRLNNEKLILEQLAKLPALAPSVPTLIDRTLFEQGSVLLTNAFNGKPSSLRLQEQHRRWLERCVQPVTAPALSSPLADFDPAVIHRMNISHLVRSAHSSLRDCVLPVAVTHGDFAPWNILLEGNNLRVFDWEYAVMNGLPEWDALYFQIRVAVTTYSASPQQLDSLIRLYVLSLQPVDRHGAILEAIALLVLVTLAVRSYLSGEKNECERFALAATLIESDLQASNVLHP